LPRCFCGFGQSFLGLCFLGSRIGVNQCLDGPCRHSGDDLDRSADRETEIAVRASIENVAETMSRQVDRELARARSRGAVRHKAKLSTELAPLVRTLIATLVRTPAGVRVSLDQQIPEVLSVPMDRADLAEVLGNVLDNAARHAAARVRIAAYPEAAGANIVIEDDGQGIAPEAQARVVERGIRLDERAEGAGLGLAIVQDVLEAYGWQLTLGNSEKLGGLRATLAPVGQAAFSS
jgi:signal transduction histidine kinase